MLDAKEIAFWSVGRWVNRIPESPISRFCNDTRSLENGDVFVAIKTERRDGHDFLGQASEKGALAALVDSEQPGSTLPQLLVEDTLVGLTAIARSYRRNWKARVIGLTGSCGKTTTKDLLIHLLGGRPVAQGTRGNLNNLIGVPLTILEVDERECSFVVVEAGISECGEMDTLGSIIQPDIAVFTAIGPAHLEGLGSEETIVAEKSKLLDYAPGARVFLGETCAPYLESRFPSDSVLIAEENSSVGGVQYRVSQDESQMQIQFLDSGEEYQINGYSKALASNVALAISVARELGIKAVEIADRLKEWTPGAMRAEWMTLGKVRAYVDCYNANPLSMLDSLDTFQNLSKPNSDRLYVIGSMEELGSESDYWHRKVGAALDLRSQDRAYLVGEGAEAMREGFESDTKVEIVPDVESLAPVLADFSGDLFLKGSRRYRLERVIEPLQAVRANERASC